MGHPTMQENDTAKLTPTRNRLILLLSLNIVIYQGTIHTCIHPLSDSRFR